MKNDYNPTDADREGLNNELNDMLDVYDEYDVDEIIENLINNADDFVVGRYRYIKQSKIDEIMLQEFKDNPEELGYFKPCFISDALPGNIDPDIIEKIQKTLEHNLGVFLAEFPNYIENIVEIYVREDGYGHYFSLYDSSEEEITMPNGVDYYIFRIE